MPAADAAALARSGERLAMATNSAFAAAAKPGSRRSLILAVPRMPQRILLMVGYRLSGFGYRNTAYVVVFARPGGESRDRPCIPTASACAAPGRPSRSLHPAPVTQTPRGR